MARSNLHTGIDIEGATVHGSNHCVHARRCGRTGPLSLAVVARPEGRVGGGFYRGCRLVILFSLAVVADSAPQRHLAGGSIQVV